MLPWWLSAMAMVKQQDARPESRCHMRASRVFKDCIPHLYLHQLLSDLTAGPWQTPRATTHGVQDVQLSLISRAVLVQVSHASLRTESDTEYLLVNLLNSDMATRKQSKRTSDGQTDKQISWKICIFATEMYNIICAE